MTTAGAAGHIQIVATMEDQASKKVQSLSQSLKKNLGQSFKSAALSMISFTAVLSTVGLSLTGLVVLFKNFITEVRDSNRGLGVLMTRLQLSGFSADRAAAAVERFRNNLSRTASAALPRLAESVTDFMRTLSSPALKEFVGQAEALETVFGTKMDVALAALSEAYKGNFGPLNEILGAHITKIEEIGPAIKLLAEDYESSLSPIDKAIRDLGVAWGDFVEGIRNSPIAEAGVVAATNLLAGFQQGLGAGLLRLFLLVLSPQQIIGPILNQWILAAGEFAVVALVWARVLILSLANHIIGTWATDLLRFALLGQWANLWAKLKDDVVKWAEQLWQGFVTAGEGWLSTNFISSLVLFIISPLNTFFTAMLSVWRQGGVAWATSLGEGITSTLSTVFAGIMTRIREFVANAIRALGKFAGSFSGGGSTSNFNNQSSAQTSVAPRTQSPFNAGPQAPVVIKLGERTFGTAVVEVLNGQIRVREPGLGMG